MLSVKNGMGIGTAGGVAGVEGGERAGGVGGCRIERVELDGFHRRDAEEL